MTLCLIEYFLDFYHITPRVDQNLTVGIDLGLKIPALRLLRQQIDRLSVLQRRAKELYKCP